MEIRNTLFRCFPEGPDWNTDWEGVERHPCIQKLADGMRRTPQDTVWHREGDVWIHTKMVCGALSAMEEFRSLPRRQRQELFLAALLHDTGKIRCTREEDGRLTAPHHAAASAHTARTLLWRELGMSGSREFQNFRETVCALIRYHMAAPRLGENEDRVRLLQIAAQGELAEDFSLWRLCLLGRADILGRTADDTEDLLERAALTELLADELGCLYGPKSFASPYAKRAYLKGRLKWADGELYDDTWGQVVLLCGLPGTGKDTWIRENCPGMPVVSLDEIRREMKVSPAESQGPVAVEARERARAYLRARQPFVWNATSLTPELRRKSVELFEAYQASVRIVFLETGWEEGLRRNRERGKKDPAKMVPEGRIEAMLERMTPPERFEAQQVEWRIT